ncbi:MAG: hypothetical protein N3A02_04035 [Rectinema sp.]|nr:hypothetical protein [Rectinema sp.]
MSSTGAAHLAFLAVLEQAGDLTKSVCAVRMGRRADDFVQRCWIRPAHAYLTRQMVSFLDGEIEVEVEIDEDAGEYRYRSPQWHSRILTRPLSEIALHDFCVDAWLRDLAEWIGVGKADVRAQARIPHHLWHLGDIRVSKTAEPAPVFVARRIASATPEALSSVLADPAWRRRGIVLMHARPSLPLPGCHEARALSEFIGPPDGIGEFDSGAFIKVLRSLTPPSESDQRTQYLDGQDLLLPHFEAAVRLSPARARIVKASWGTDGYPSPIVTWAEIKGTAHSSYQSFDDAFRDGKLKREDVFELVEHGKYRLRRNP